MDPTATASLLTNSRSTPAAPPAIVPYGPRLVRAVFVLLAAAAAHTWLLPMRVVPETAAQAAMKSARQAFDERPLTLVHEDIRVPLILGPRMSPLMEASLEAAPGQFDERTDAVDASLRPVGTVGTYESGDRRTPVRPVRLVTGYEGFSETTIGSPMLYRRNVVHVLDQLTGSRPASWGPSSSTAR